MRRLLPQHWSIRTKSVALVAGYIFLLLAVYAAFTRSLLRSETASTHDRLRQTATLLAAEVDAYLASGRDRLGTVARLPGMKYGLRSMPGASSEGRIPPWTSLHYLFFRSPVFTGGVFLVDRNDKLLWSEPPGRSWPAEQLAHHPTVVRTFDSGEETISVGRESSFLLDRPHVIITVPVRNPDGQIDGVLGGIVDLQAPGLLKSFEAVITTGGRFVDMIDQAGTVLASSDSERAMRRIDGGDAEVMRAAVSLTQAPWQIVSAQPRELALAEVGRFQRMLLALGSVLLLGAIIFGAPVVRGFARDIGSLTHAAETMARGDLSQPVAVQRRADELGTLARSLDMMRTELLHSRAALERRLEEREEMIRLKDTFLANISHELRTPLNAIIGYNDMLADSGVDATCRELASQVRRQAEHLHHLLSDLLTLSGLNIGRLAIEISPVQIPALLAHLRPMAERLAGSSRVELVWKCPPSLPSITTDPLRLEQILTNLISNAFKFTKQGRVEVRVVLDRGERVRFEICDTGIGIDEREQAHIFDEFWQADGAPTSSRGGVGLGLALVKKLTTMLHGEVSLRSEVGVGSTFTVTLPLRYQL
ncbi:MAG TPA: sensor histidine kinase [Terriglobales bacterium]|nr:sensor histidine kinase [Terriglobales bacterium]